MAVPHPYFPSNNTNNGKATDHMYRWDQPLWNDSQSLRSKDTACGPTPPYIPLDHK
ncbi:hypothetical protein PENSUB_9370 [Penicillium subrubescens]|uniref:Uncharacterized protein n=1 Tax=Penicillium subrubescens TaxID=1316194 RepID=A0A1Q5TDH8_9EURO|nr:hypothetical protein PENSUB_9370 [Penicillium subrubescens]